MLFRKTFNKIFPARTIRKKIAKAIYLLFFDWNKFKKNLKTFFHLWKQGGFRAVFPNVVSTGHTETNQITIMPESALVHKGSIMRAAPNKSSIITQGKAVKTFVKLGVTYWKCEQTGTIFSKPLDQSNKVGGCYEVERNNEDDNIERIRRVKMITGKPNPKVLDYGCGNGMLVKAMNENGCEAIGYDAFNPEFDRMGVDVDCVIMIEVVEHLSHPFKEFGQVYDSLLKGGKVYIETSFADWLTKEDSYISPEVGHSTIFTHKGLDMLMQSKGFKVLPALNRNVRLYEK